MADIVPPDLYYRDFCEWALDQAQAIRDLREIALRSNEVAAAVHRLDWDNLIEEIEDLAGRHRSELRNRIGTVVEHLLKLERGVADGPRQGWEETVARSRIEISRLLDDSPSLRRLVPDILRDGDLVKISALVLDGLIKRGEAPLGATAPTYTEHQVLDDWWPDRKGTAS